MKTFSLLSLIILSFFLVACDSKPGKPESDPSSSSDPSLKEKAKELVGENSWSAEDDTTFLKEAYRHNYKIIRLSQAAESKTKTMALKNFSGQSIQYYQNLNGQIELMGEKFTGFSPADPPEETEQLEDLREKKENEFDKAYLDLLASLINQQKDSFEKASEKAYSNTIRNWAAKITSNLRAHSTAVEELAEDLKN